MPEHIPHDFSEELRVQYVFTKYHHSAFLFLLEKQACLTNQGKTGIRLLLTKTIFRISWNCQIRKLAFLGAEGRVNHIHPRQRQWRERKKRKKINWVEKSVTDISVDQDSDYVSEKRSPDQVTCPLLQKIRSKGFKGNWCWQLLHLYAMWHTRSKLLATFWTICQGREIIIFFYILLSRTLSHLGVLPPALCPTTLCFIFQPGFKRSPLM